MIHGHGGNIYDFARRLNCRPSEILDMSSNMNPLGPPPGLLQYLTENMEAITRLPEVDAGSAVERFGRFIGVDSDCLLAGNGTTQFIYAIPQMLKTSKALIVGPTYSDYGDACRLQGIPCTFLLANESGEFNPDIEQLDRALDKVDTIFICNPNNPTGALIPADALRDLCRSHSEKNFIIDESYLDFVPNAENETMVNSGLNNVMVLLSVSKIFKIPGLRTGFIKACGDRIEKFKQHLLPWSTNSLAQLAIDYIADEKVMIQAFIKETRHNILNQRRQFYSALGNAGHFRLFISQAPFVLIKLRGGLSANYVWQRLARKKILIRRCTNVQGLSDRFIRISLKSPDNNRLLAARLLAISRGAEKEGGSLEELRVAC
ncbi:MAG: pyridoxal phosphate-dependent class II aminotransferase [bacterium]|nr:pyridoxal phosphate-dependent class II aminotransferase [bacterium]